MTGATLTATHPYSVIGLGNVFLGDDGFGPLAVETFRSQFAYGPEVEVLDLGTPGLDLAPYLYDRKLVVIVDAVAFALPGTTRACGILSLICASLIAVLLS